MLLFSCSIDDLLKDSDSEDEEKKVKKAKVTKKQASAPQAWLREGGDDDITDFMDTSAAKKVMGKMLTLNKE